PPPTAPHAAKAQLVPGVLRVARDTRVDRPERIGDRTTRIRAQATDQDVAGALQLVLDRRVIEPREPAMRSAVGCEIKASRPPLLDSGPAQMRQAIPGVSDVPGIRHPDVIRNKERGGGEAQVGENRISMLGERGVAVIKCQQKRAWCVVRGAWYSKLG